MHALFVIKQNEEIYTKVESCGKVVISRKKKRYKLEFA